MPSYPPFCARPYEPSQFGEVAALADAQGLHGVYLRNDLERGLGEAMLLWGEDRLLGCAYFGARGNLLLAEREPLDPARLADAVHQSGWPWRIAMGAGPAIDALATRLLAPPLVHRDQIYYGSAPHEAAILPRADEVRPARRADKDLLVAATLDLHLQDLAIDPRRVDRRWLSDMLAQRIAEGSTLVLGPSGAFHSKLDLGSQGAAGVVIEGVYTFPTARGHGHAAALVAGAVRSQPGPVVCLHVSAANLSARAAYARAGLCPERTWRLLLCN